MERTRDDELLTIKEAAAFLKISTMTLSRWLKQGRLTKYRIGVRAVRLRRSEVEALLWPDEQDDLVEDDELLNIPPLTPEEIASQQAAMEQARALRERQLRSRGGKYFPSSAELIAREREERSIAP